MRKPIAVLVALLALVVSGCGDSVDQSAYVQSVTRVQEKTQSSAAAVGAKLKNAKTPEEIGDDLGELATDIKANAKSLAAIEAPDNVTKQHGQYVDLMNRFGTDLQALAAKVKAATPAKVKGILTGATKLTADLKTDESAIIQSINTALQS